MMPGLAVLCAALLAGGTTKSLPPVSVFADGCFCPGWWTLDIDATGRLKVSLNGQDVAVRMLATEERGTLSRLVDALPSTKAKYQFGVSYVDVSAVFDLTVGTGGRKRQYFVTDTLESDKTRPELQPVLNLLAFLRGLVRERQALTPPQPAEMAEQGP